MSMLIFIRGWMDTAFLSTPWGYAVDDVPRGETWLGCNRLEGICLIRGVWLVYSHSDIERE